MKVGILAGFSILKSNQCVSQGKNGPLSVVSDNNGLKKNLILYLKGRRHDKGMGG